jgi:VIT1/CCC1 family predicted Fe2+/Mn2+ transporter
MMPHEIDNPQTGGEINLFKSTQEVKEPFREDRLMNPVERISEILFGLIMALSFTCAISVAEAADADVKELLIAVIGCNIAWGIIDAIMYLMISLAQRGRNIAILNYIRNTNQEEKAREYIAQTIAPELATFIGPGPLEKIRMEIINTAPKRSRPRILWNDLKGAISVFLLVVISTIPVAIPFTIFNKVHLALRISNGIAVLLLFWGGWILARYCGFNKLRTGLYLALVGIGLVFLTISLGG